MDSFKNTIESAMVSVGKEVAAKVSDSTILGLGSGSAVAKFAKALGDRVKSGELHNVRIVPSSMQAWLMAKEHSLALYSDSAHCPASLDLAVDGADQVSLETRAMIKGGGGALLREKIILSSSNESLILIDSSKVVAKLERTVPIEVTQFAFETVQEVLRKSFHANPSLRKLEKGYPFFTESGNLILDCIFEKGINEPKELERSIKSIPGVVEAGIFTCRVDKFYVGNEEGKLVTY
ncbi:MAG: ribose 5-phosphate isomerase A [Nitrososphaerales archaeon]